MKTLILAVLFMVGCAGLPTNNHDKTAQDVEKSKITKEYAQCRLELWCTRTEDSLLKKGAFTAIGVYFGTTIEGACVKHHAAWGFDYRAPVEERCGKKSDYANDE